MSKQAERVKFHPINEEAALFPKPMVPVLPVLSANSLFGGGTQSYRSRFFEGDALPVRRGRIGIVMALQAMGTGPGSAVLVPAYHCRSMIEPILWLGATVRFYKLKPNLEIDLEDVRHKLERSTKALLLVHFFGFPQPLALVRTLCSEHGIALIEDCAHAFFGESEGSPLGSVGDFSIASMPKFFPAVDGGILCPASRITGTLHSSGLFGQVKAAYEMVGLATRYNRLQVLGAMAGLAATIRQVLRSERATVTAAGSEPNIPSVDELMQCFNPEEIGLRATHASRLVTCWSGKAKNAERRRMHYRYLSEKLSGLPRTELVFPVLPPGVIPYMFPILLKAPARDFAPLKRLRVPIWRWEEIAYSECLVSQDYRMRLLQIPCHQGLCQSELDWMIARFREVLDSH
ncbi:DegT/DnrJ/EryC1/StrS aminotransferase [Nitrosococcus oceani ATCC 19707]|uniref:DegT/DnrJ/EryC1/StrS aminotransferase n=2 Tax=Nitrosococcus oceani TaxID=1229 RepID=Q3J9S4_NITOC|nr:DegT/DnrJ/EryC1/StrS family aminotransferase [Nitrosococcus oceani]ABA58422.1 DegT/DnrJ/EryC1/StrS aminotransferase [Nitrosococcus oceani ATCC 19707]EDZ67061.1 DegT/DnrJ/EryC1/StrS aminotransferase family [Nitrosococcus oceani AFC27]KFI19136.1 aminotransferase DegT [Nitrosococcus oceani C-27]GEM18816.1 aminotransferase DegT [Nitrosococcus oceani]